MAEPSCPWLFNSWIFRTWSAVNTTGWSTVNPAARERMPTTRAMAAMMIDRIGTITGDPANLVINATTQNSAATEKARLVMGFFIPSTLRRAGKLFHTVGPITSLKEDKNMTLVDKQDNEVRVNRNEAASRYEITYADSDEVVGFADYVINDNDRIFYHTKVDEDYGGRGLASILIREAIEDTFPTGQVVVGLCPFVSGYVEKNGYDGGYRAGTPEDEAFVEEMQR